MPLGGRGPRPGGPQESCPEWVWPSSQRRSDYRTAGGCCLPCRAAAGKPVFGSSLVGPGGCLPSPGGCSGTAFSGVGPWAPPPLPATAGILEAPLHGPCFPWPWWSCWLGHRPRRVAGRGPPCPWLLGRAAGLGSWLGAVLCGAVARAWPLRLDTGRTWWCKGAPGEACSHDPEWSLQGKHRVRGGSGGCTGAPARGGFPWGQRGSEKTAGHPRSSPARSPLGHEWKGPVGHTSSQTWPPWRG